MSENQNFIRAKIEASIRLKTELLQDERILRELEAVTAATVVALKAGNKVLWCGNGGSAADAQHLAAELSGRFYYDRPPLPSDALHVNTSYITAVANDYSYEEIYSRLIEGMGKKGDVLIGLSTSGNSPNVIRALMTARDKGLVTVGFTGRTGGGMKEYCDYLLAIPSTDTPRIQECHMLLGHTLCEMVERNIFPRDEG